VPAWPAQKIKITTNKLVPSKTMKFLSSSLPFHPHLYLEIQFFKKITLEENSLDGLKPSLIKKKLKQFYFRLIKTILNRNLSSSFH